MPIVWRDWLEIPGDGPLVMRDRAILELLYSSGLRLSELTSLNLGDVDLADGTVSVTGKGGKDRIVPVGRFARDALQKWLRERSSLADADEAAIFVSQRGTRLSPRSVQARVDHWAQAAGDRHPGLSAPFPPFLCDAPARVEPRPARRPGAPGSRQHQHDAGLYAP